MEIWIRSSRAEPDSNSWHFSRVFWKPKVVLKGFVADFGTALFHGQMQLKICHRINGFVK